MVAERGGPRDRVDKRRDSGDFRRDAEGHGLWKNERKERKSKLQEIVCADRGNR